MAENKPLKVHITGVYGLIGNLVYRHLSEQGNRYDVNGSGRRAVSSDRADEGSIVQLPPDHFMIADLTDAAAVSEAMRGMDAVLHIAAVPDPFAPFQDVLASNIVGTYNVLEACREAGILRLVYASSIMVSAGYHVYQEPYRAIRECRMQDIPETIPMITHLDPPRPTDPYSASKVWGEAICRTYADAYGISTVCLRIGYVNKKDYCSLAYADSIWCSQRDVVNITELALIATEKPRFDICYGVSDNKYRWVDLEHARERLGYVPQDSVERANAAAGWHHE
jgi:NAD+ dependent glucose-6-phosphate dehydrogenase